MVGATALVTELIPLAFAALVLLGIVEAVRRRRNPSEPHELSVYSSPKPVSKPLAFVQFVAIGLLAIASLVIMPVRFAHELSDHVYLRRLNPDAVASITIGNRGFTSAAQITSIARALNHIEWFASNHGGWASDVDLFIRERSGQQRYFRVALYLRETGAVISFIRPSQNGGMTWQDGYAFSRELPGVLQQLGAPLPSNSRR